MKKTGYCSAMSYEPLHHKYRPQTFSHLVGQAAIATTLSNALRQNRVAPAYLFSGPRGTGKTSSARILAKSLNCLQADKPTPDPCGQCDICRSITQGTALDVIEIDAASNTGVDNIRELIERAQFAPVQCRHKVYVIDECHMLSTAAFNALLKTLEEPPEHVVFVLATTDPQRVLPTIISRCQRFDFRRIPLADMVTHLTIIAKAEAIAIQPDALRLVAQMAQGGLRDAESLLDQLSLLEGEVTIERVWDLVGAVPERDLLTLVEKITQGDSAAVLDQARHLMNRGREPLIVLQSLAGFYRDLLIAKTAPERADLVAITPSTWDAMTAFVAAIELPILLLGQQHLRAAEAQVKNTTQPRLWLEVALIGLLPGALVNLPTQTVSSAPSQGVALQSQLAPSQPVPSQPVPKDQLTSSPVAIANATHGETAKQAPEPISLTVNTADDSATHASADASHPNDASEASPLHADANPVVPENLPEIWGQIVAVLQPLGTRALMQQQGRLLSFADNQAQVGISSQPLFKMAKQRLPNVETAFKQVFGREIKVSFEIAIPPEIGAESEPQNGPNELTQSGLGVSSLDKRLDKRGVALPPPLKPAAPTPQPPNTHAQPQNAQSFQEISPLPATDSPARSVSPPLAHEGGSHWQSETDLDRAVKSFAQFFNGQVVNLDDDVGSGAVNGNGTSRTRDRDVPF